MNAISVTGATLLQNFNVKIEFSDNTCKVIDFGRNWDLIFPVYSLYTGNLYEQCC